MDQIESAGRHLAGSSMRAMDGEEGGEVADESVR
jgi:hypothetical protein